MEPSISNRFRDQIFLAPLTKGGNLPFRRLCVEFGARATMGEMALAHKLLKGSRSELALLRRAPDEEFFGAQIAGRKPEQLAAAAQLAQEHGADFVDLNLGCPIDLLCRRGLGAALMEKPARVGRLVEAMVEAVDIPITVKIRLGWQEDKPRYLEVGRAAAAAGAAAVTLHGRSRKQRYRRAANWDAVRELTEELEIPVIGNGDLMTWRDVAQRREQSGCASVMLARGALIKPWIFAEIRDGRDYLLQADARAHIARRYVELAREHFGRDERGERRVREFLAFHLDFYTRYRPQASEEMSGDDHPLIQTRQGEPPETEGWKRWLYESDPENITALVEHLLAAESIVTREESLNALHAAD